MSSNTPTVSILIPLYNHEDYIEACLDSILNQTYQDFEICVVDDASTDGSADKVRSYDDPRIHLQVLPENLGIAGTAQTAYRMSSGRYLARMNSDDVWEEDKLERQVSWLDSHPEDAVVFTRVQVVGEDGSPSDEHPAHQKVYDQENKPQAAWLRRLFFKGNCLCMPCMMIRREAYESVGGEDRRLASLMDFNMWVQICFRYKIHVLPKRMTHFRIRAGEANASGDRLEIRLRTFMESKQVLDNFLAIQDVDSLKAIFPECTDFGEPEQNTIQYFLARIALKADHSFHRMWGMDLLYRCFADRDLAETIGNRYGFRYADLHRLAASEDPYNLEAAQNGGQYYEGLLAARAQLEDERQKILELDVEKEHMEARIGELQETLEKTEYKLKQSDVALQQTNAALQQMLRSRSWRWTEPLRRVLARIGNP